MNIHEIKVNRKKLGEHISHRAISEQMTHSQRYKLREEAFTSAPGVSTSRSSLTCQQKLKISLEITNYWARTLALQSESQP